MLEQQIALTGAAFLGPDPEIVCLGEVAGAPCGSRGKQPDCAIVRPDGPADCQAIQRPLKLLLLDVTAGGAEMIIAPGPGGRVPAQVAQDRSWEGVRLSFVATSASMVATDGDPVLLKDHGVER